MVRIRERESLLGSRAGRLSTIAVDRPLAQLLRCSSHAVLLHEHVLLLLLLLLQHEVGKALLLLLLLLLLAISSHTALPRSILRNTKTVTRLQTLHVLPHTLGNLPCTGTPSL